MNRGFQEMITVDDSILLGSDFGVMRSNDFGRTWFDLDTNLATMKMEKATNGHIFAEAKRNWMTNYALLRSDDTGRTWTSVLDVSYQVLPFEVFGTSVVAWVPGSGVYQSTNDGGSWNLVHQFSDTTCYSLTKSNTGSLFAYGLSETSGILKSLDTGRTWMQCGNSMGNHVFSSLVVDRHNTLIAAGFNSDSTANFVDSVSRIFISQNCGYSWSEFPTTCMPATNRLHTINTITVDKDGYLYAGTMEDGIYRSVNSYLKINEKASSTVPNHLTINKVFPNPTNGHITISYSLPDRSNVYVNLFNVQGELVKHVFLPDLASGKHNYSLNVTNQASGTYFVRVSSQRQTITNSVLILK